MGRAPSCTLVSGCADGVITAAADLSVRGFGFNSPPSLPPHQPASAARNPRTAAVGPRTNRVHLTLLWDEVARAFVIYRAHRRTGIRRVRVMAHTQLYLVRHGEQDPASDHTREGGLS